MLMSRLCTDGRTDGNVKVEQYSAEAESAIGAVSNLYECFWSKTGLLTFHFLTVSGNSTLRAWCITMHNCAFYCGQKWILMCALQT